VADLIYSVMIIYVGEDGTEKSRLVGPNKFASWSRLVASVRP